MRKEVFSAYRGLGRLLSYFCFVMKLTLSSRSGFALFTCMKSLSLGGVRFA